MAIDYDAAALAAVRRYCGWIVTPPATVTITVDGPGGRVLSLPTLQLTTVSAVVEDGVALNVSDLRWSVDRGQVYKKSGASWTSNAAGISVTMTHGFSSAPDFDVAVAQTKAGLQAVAARTDAALTGLKVDDVEYQWSVTLLQSSNINTDLLAPYRILQSP